MPPHIRMLTGMKKAEPNSPLILRTLSKPISRDRISISLKDPRAMVRIKLPKSLDGPLPPETNTNNGRAASHNRRHSSTILNLSGVRLLTNKGPLAIIDVDPPNIL